MIISAGGCRSTREFDPLDVILIRHKLATCRNGLKRTMADFCGSQRAAGCGESLIKVGFSYRNLLLSL
jgi:hypothetical protein